MFAELLAQIASSLKARNVPYMIIGGQAVLLHGEPRLTRDIDVTLGTDITRLPDLLRSIEDISLACLPDDVQSFVRKTMVLPTRHDGSGIRVDFIFSYTPYETEAIARAHMVPMAGREIAFASPEDLVIHKVFAGRPRDLEDVRSVLLKNPSLDLDLVRRLLAEFDAASDDGGLSEAFEKILADVRK